MPVRTDTSLIAHRGFAGVNPENTLTAFEAAARHPDVDTVELDVMPTADGEVVVFHDDTPARVTDAPPALCDRPVWTFDYTELQSFTVLDSGEPIPRLVDVLDAVPAGVAVNVELKHPGRSFVECGPLEEPTLAEQRTVWRDFVAAVVDILRRYGHDYLLSSFHEGALAAVRDIAPSLPIAAVFFESVAAGLAVARRHDAEYFHLPWNMVAGTSLFNESYVGGPYESVDLVEVAHREGRRVNVWTVTELRQGAELLLAGVDGLIADFPSVRPGRGTTDRPSAAEGAD